MIVKNTNPVHGQGLAPADAAMLDEKAAREVAEYLSFREEYAPTPLRSLPALAAATGVASINVKDESSRLGLGSFKALGGAFAVIKLVLEEAGRLNGRVFGYDEMFAPDVREVAASITVACATDGNHGRSVAQGARLIGARSAIFVHSGVSDLRIEAIESFGAQIIRVRGNYDDSVEEATRVCAERGWMTVSDTSWAGYSRITGLVMQGYTAMLTEALAQLPQPPSHVFVQAGVGGLAAAVAGHLALRFGESRPVLVVVEPDRAACLYRSAEMGHPVKIEAHQPTVMAMLECYEPSVIAWRILARTADYFMTVEENDAVAVMKLLARPNGSDPAIVAGESGGVGLAGFLRLAGSSAAAEMGLGPDARVFVINTEGATDPSLYAELVGKAPAHLTA